MPTLRISEVARRAGLRPSAVRYYERIGILPAAARRSGQRLYDETVLHRLALIDVARRTGFTLADIRVLFFGFREGTPASARWRALSRRKLAELDAGLRRLREMRRILIRLSDCCRCSELMECGRRLSAARSRYPAAPSLPRP